MRTIILFTLLFVGSISNAQVGIGTNTPSGNAALDITSPNKGLMLPRVGDTSAVANPSAGLLVYNVNGKTPAFHNGISWKTFATTATNSDNDSITYTLTGGPAGFTDGTYTIQALGHGLVNQGGSASFQSINFTKTLDANSTGFAKNVAKGTGPGKSAFIMEFKFYKTGSATPYYSIKASSIQVEAFQFSGSGGGNNFTESITIAPVIFGYKNWITNASFGWNTSTNIEVQY